MIRTYDCHSFRFRGKKAFYASLGFLSMMFFLETSPSFAKDLTAVGEPSGLAPQSTISGTITDADGIPLPGATVVVKGTTTGTVADFDGNYSIEANRGDVLIFSFTGYTPKEMTVGSSTTIDVSLAEGVSLDEVIVTGYSVESKRETTAAVSVVKAEELAAIPSGNVEQQLQGRVAGVTVITNGQPGTTSQIRVRGFGSFGGNQPLYVVDGVPVDNIDFINPDDIETTTVLKDAAAASIYGARAASGVIVYTTKQSSRDRAKATFTLNVTTGVTDPNVNGAPKMLSPMDQAIWTHIAYENNAQVNGEPVDYNHPQYGSNATPTLPDYLYADGASGVSASDVDLAAIRAHYEADPDKVFLIKPNLRGTNWYKEITRIAPQARVSLGLKGGGENNRYYFGLSMQEQDGVVLEQKFQRYTARFNSEWDITPWLSIGENFQTTYRSVRGIVGGNGGIESADDESAILSAFRMPTIIPVYDEFGNYASTIAAGFNNPRNPVRELVNNTGDDNAYAIGGFGNLYLLLKPVEGLTLRSSLGGNYYNSYFVDYGYKYLGDSEPQASDTFGEGSSYGFSWVFTNTATYEKKFGKHGFKILGGVEALNTGKGRGLNGSGINPFSTDLDYINLNVVQSPVVGSSANSGVNFYSLFGKLDYSFNDRYYVTGVVRRDGSSRFGANNRYGIFPAFSAAWRAIEEPVFKDMDWLSDLKFRVGWGEMGNSNNVAPTNQYTLYASAKDNTLYPIGGQNSGADEGFAQSRIGNPNAKWETSETLNVGMDFSLFNNKLEFQGDLWEKKTRDLLYAIPLAGVTGNWAAAPAVNVATMSNKGLDFQIVNRGNFTEDFSYTLTLNNSFLKNEITKLADNIDYFDGPALRSLTPVRNAVGHSLSSFYGYKMIGYFNTEEEVANSPAQDGKGLGRFRYEDVNGDGSITPDDRTFIGSPVPKYTGGATLNLRYKNIEFETYWYASFGNDIFNQSKQYTHFFGTFEGSGKGEVAKRSWTPALGNSAEAPRWESAANISTSGAPNSWYVEDGSYVRLQRLAFTYNFDRNLLDKWGLSKFSLGIAANNIWTITNYSGIDPGIGGPDSNFGVDVGNFPVTPSYVMSLELGL